MPFIPEETIERIEVGVDDLKEAVRAQTQAVMILNDRAKVTNEILAKVHEAVTKPAGGDDLGDLLRALVEADKRHAAVLQTVLAAVQKLGT
jgi:uncharacterized membrane-anchored protein YjiN (DUF445 family)